MIEHIFPNLVSLTGDEDLTGTIWTETRIQLKLALITLFTSVSVIYLIFGRNLNINYYIDIFFYADAAVTQYILATGTLPSAESIPFTNMWGKVGTRIENPIFPLLLSSLQLTTGTNISYLYTGLPTFLLLSLSLYKFFKIIGVKLFPSVLLAIGSSIGSITTSFDVMTLPTLAQALLFIGVLTTYIHISGGNKHSGSLSTIVPIFLILIFLFYFYPLYFFAFAGVVSVSGAVCYLISIRFGNYLAILVVTLFISLDISSLGSYTSNLAAVIDNLVNFNINILNSSSSMTFETAYSSTYYSLIYFPLILLPAIYGGFLMISDVKSYRNPISIISVSWGIAIFALSTAFILTATSWVSARSYFYAFPIMMLGVARVLRKFQIKWQSLFTILFLVLVLTSLGLQLGLPQVSVQSYEAGEVSGSVWAGEYVEEKIITDVKLGAPLAARGDFSAEYPRDYAKLKAVYYSENSSEFAASTSHPIVISKEMLQSGLFAVQSSHTPISREAYDKRIVTSNKLYSNGQSSVIRND